MKTYLSNILIFLCWAGTVVSQNLPFPENDAVWKESHTTFAGPVLFHAALCGDTAISGTAYGKVYELQVNQQLEITGKTYLGGLRSEGTKVWFLPFYTAEEHLLYDFGLQEGESITLNAYYFSEPVTRWVDSVKTVILGGTLRKVIYFKPVSQFATVEYWIEGVGSSYGLLGRATDAGGDIGFELLCFGHENEYVYLTLIECFLPQLENCGPVNASIEEIHAQTVLVLSPNPAAGFVKIELSGSGLPLNWRLKIFDQNARLAKVLQPSALVVQVDTKAFSQGLYHLVAEDEIGRVIALGRLTVQD